MSAELLRDAAALMRTRAKGADAPQVATWCQDTHILLEISDGTYAHAASWHPAVALDVAGFLDFAAAYGDQPEPQSPTVQFAVAIARAYLQEVLNV